MPDFVIKDDEKSVGPPPLPENYGKPLVPLSAAERIVSLDVLRGFALLGILIANMVNFSQPLEVFGFRNGFWFGPVDKLADWISILLVEGKFYPLFSFLFGLGFSMQMDRADSRELNFIPTYRRRLFVLMGFGAAHGIFLWEGDVLLAYALCGFLLVLFRNRKPVTIAIWAVATILLPALLILAGGLVFHMLSGNAEFAQVMKEVYAEDAEVGSELIQAFVTGGYGDAVSYRFGEIILTNVCTLIFAPAFLGLFLIGLLLIGMGIISIFGPVLTFAYVAGIVMLIHKRPSLTILPPIASVGRSDGANQLLGAICNRHYDFLWLRVRPGWKRGEAWDDRNRFVHFRRTDRLQRVLAEVLPLWADGMALAEPDIWKTAADDSGKNLGAKLIPP
jgi:uncharacterized membrane protein YeiB|tara:strand:+ start:42475 stop:43647 length:1173 start_codon:yes stop_codon:yes gene_type:complete